MRDREGEGGARSFKVRGEGGGEGGLIAGEP